MHIQIPAGARYIIEQLNQAGFEAYVVGGCVRDSLLGKTPNDWDITTSATPPEVKRIFGRTIDTGILHGTVTVLVPREALGGKSGAHTDYAFEVTTYRVDGEYKDHRRPEEVAFTASLKEDLRRRDFTINAMAYNETDGLVDIFGGAEDLKQGVIRCVGEARERFDEDALRILRAVRFAAQLDFAIEEKTREAMRKQARFLEHISAERIQAELTKLLTSDHPDRLREAYELGLTKVFLPEFDAMMPVEQNSPYHCYTVGEHTLRVLLATPKDMVLRYSALFHDIGKPACKTTGEDGRDHFHGHPSVSEKMAKTILRRLKMDNATIERVQRLVRNHDYGISGGDINIRSVRRFLSKLGKEHFDDYMCLRKADLAGQSDYRLAERTAAVEALQAMYGQILAAEDCLKLSDLAVDGRTLMELGIPAGRRMGEILRSLFERVLEEPELNRREILEDIVKKEYMDR